MSLRMRPALAPLLAPVAVVALATNAAAIIDPGPYYRPDSDSTTTIGDCDHPSDGRLSFFVAIDTGLETAPEGYDIDSLNIQNIDDGAIDPDLRNPEVSVKHLRWTYGIMDHKRFVPTSSVFHAGNSVQYTGEYYSEADATDVQAVLFEIVWKVVDDPAVRTLSCVITLDKYRTSY